MSELKIEGELIKIAPVEKISEKFSKQQIVVKTLDQYPQEVAFDVLEKNFERVEGLKLGDKLEVSFNVKGREWQGRYFVNLQAWKIWLVRAPQNAPQAEGEKAEEKGDDLPF